MLILPVLHHQLHAPHERRYFAVLRGSRKKRIAQGSGVQVQDVNRLLKQFMPRQKMMKRMQRGGTPGAEF